MLLNKRFLWKTSTVIICSSIMIAIILFVTIISVISNNLGKQIERVQQETFNQVTEAIKNSVHVDPSLAGLDLFIRKGYKITVFDTTSNTFIYPQELTFRGAIDGALQISTPKDVDGYLTDFTIGNSKVYVSYPIQLKAPEITNIVRESIPLLLLIITLLVAVIISVYVRLYRNEKRKLDVLFNLTKQRVDSETISQKDFGIRMKDHAVIEQQVKELYDSLEKSNKKIKQEMLVVKELERNNIALLQGITHEMKTPLMSTKLLIGQIQTQVAENDLFPSVLQQMTNLEKLIHEVLFVTQRKHATKEQSQIAVSILLEQALEKYEVLLEDRGIDVEVVMSAEFQLLFDNKMFEKILSNLLSNAIHYTNKQTTITIVITSDSLKIINPIAEANHISMATIGQPFVSFGPNGGTGLGLYLITMMLLNYPYELVTHINEQGLFVAEIITMK